LCIIDYSVRIGGEELKINSQFWYDNIIHKMHIKNNDNEESRPVWTGFANNDVGNTMQIAVCDDEKIYLDMIKGYLKDCLASCDDDFFVNIDTYTSGESLLDAYNNGARYDLVFLDIRMKRLSGYDTAKSIRSFDNKAMIIFITSLVDYIFSSFEYKPFWFLTKPLSEEKFKYVFFKALSEIQNSRNKVYSFFSRENGLVSLEISNIIYLESALRRINIYSNTQQFTYYASINEEEEKLKKYDFVRIHRSYLVNMSYIQRINKENVVLKNSIVLPLSEHRFKAVFDNFTSYLARCSV